MQSLAAALLIAGSHPRPRGDMALGGKARHIIANFSENAADGEPLQAGDLHDAVNGLLVGTEALLNLHRQAMQTLFQELDMLEQMLEQDAMMGIDASFQGLTQLGQLTA